MVKLLLLLSLMVISVHSCNVPNSKKSTSEELQKDELTKVLIVNPSPEGIFCGGQVVQKSIVAVDANSVCYFGKSVESVEVSDLEGLILDHIERTKDSTVEFHGDGDSKLKIALEVIDICKRNHLKFVMKKKKV